ncbi:hypothetical protein PV410_39965 [Streptomyces sp. PA03-5A]|nr:hypothetical protein [Streptomyces sp. PA03-5A]
MARSTIQEKLSGRSSLNLTQVLSIVEALAEHARLNGNPLPPNEIDQAVWRERIVASPERQPDTRRVDNLDYAAPALDWNVEPLKYAHMNDLVAIMQDSTALPVARWLPKVLRGMMQAEMDITGFLKKAAQDTPLNVVQTLTSLEDEFPPTDQVGWTITENNMTVGPLLRYAADGHGRNATPAIVAGLRRSNLGHLVNDFLIRLASGYTPANLLAIVDHLRSAALNKDAERLLGFIGGHRPAARFVDTLTNFQKGGRIGDAEKILKGVAAENWYRARGIVEVLENSSAPHEVFRQVALGVPWGKHSEYAQHLEEAGLKQFAALVQKVATEAPF